MGSKENSYFLSINKRSIGNLSSGAKRDLKLLAEENVVNAINNQGCDFGDDVRSTFLVVFNKDCSLMASSHGDHTVRVSDVITLKCKNVLRGHLRTPWALCFHPSLSSLLASGCLSGEVRIWDLEGGCEIWRNTGNFAPIASLAFHPSDHVLLIGTGNQLNFWDWRESKPFAVCTTKTPDEKIRYVKFDNIGYHLVVGISNPDEKDAATLGEHTKDAASQASLRPSAELDRAALEPMDPLLVRYQALLDRYHEFRREYRRMFAARQSSIAEEPSILGAGASNAAEPAPITSWDTERASFVPRYSRMSDLLGSSIRAIHNLSDEEAHEDVRSVECFRTPSSNIYIIETRRLSGSGATSASSLAASSTAAGLAGSAEDVPSTSLEAAPPASRPPSSSVIDVSQDAFAISEEVVHEATAVRATILENRLRTSADATMPSERKRRHAAEADEQAIVTNKCDPNDEHGPTEQPKRACIEESSCAAMPSQPSAKGANEQPQFPRLFETYRIRTAGPGPSREESADDARAQTRARLRLAPLFSQVEAARADRPHAAIPLSFGITADARPESESRLVYSRTDLLAREQAELIRARSQILSRFSIVESRLTQAIRSPRITVTPPESADPPSESSNIEALLSEEDRAEYERFQRSERFFRRRNALGDSSDTSNADLPRFRRRLYQPNLGSSDPSSSSTTTAAMNSTTSTTSSTTTTTTSSSRDQSRRFLHPNDANNILDEAVNFPEDPFQAAINRAIAGILHARGDPAVAVNIANITHRIHYYPFVPGALPDLTDRKRHLLVSRCKIHNDASVDISRDGQVLATFVPPERSFSAASHTNLSIYSLAPQTLGQCLFRKSFGPNAVSVGISPLTRYVIVGLAARRIIVRLSPYQLMAQVYELQRPAASDDAESMKLVRSVFHSLDPHRLHHPHVSVNFTSFIPGPNGHAEGIVYGTNRGDVRICRPGMMMSRGKKMVDVSIETEADITGEPSPLENPVYFSAERTRRRLMNILELSQSDFSTTASTQTSPPQN